MEMTDTGKNRETSRLGTGPSFIFFGNGQYMFLATASDLVIPRSVRRMANATRNLHEPSNPAFGDPSFVRRTARRTRDDGVPAGRLGTSPSFLFCGKGQ
jgi:hypothetical protein